MQGIMETLGKLEGLLYKILVWVVLIPKTLLKVVLHPDWAADYIKDELDPNKGKSRFDEYFSPVVLLLFVALMPFFVWSFLPNPGIVITSPSTENPTKVRTVEFDANITFISTSTEGFVTTFWTVEKEFYDGTNYSFPVKYHNRFTNNPSEINSTDFYNYKQIDSHTIQDFNVFEFPEAGNYWVVVNASKFDANGYLIETAVSNLNVYVPAENSQDNVIVYARTKPDENKPLIQNISDQLKSEKTIFMALGLLIPPLLFTLAVKMFGQNKLGEDDSKELNKAKDQLSEDNLKETFYVQCYYFAPLALIFWATRYALQLFTPDVFFRYDTDLNLIILLPLILSVFWFVSVQTHAVSKEANISGGLALVVVLVCMFILGVGALFVVFKDQPNLQDLARRSSIWLYPLLAVGLLSMYHVLSILQKRKEKTVVSTGDKLLVGGIVSIVFIALCLVLIVGRAEPLASADIDSTQQGYIVQAEEQFIDLEAEKFHAEEFNEDMSDWGPYFMTNGVANQVNLNTKNGSLVFNLSQFEDQIPNVYLIYNAFRYADVQVEAIAENKSENENALSLVCRFHGSGWYEFEVSNTGAYSIYAFDDIQGYTELASGESPAITTGASENTVTAICQGDKLTLKVNGTTLDTVQDTKFNYSEGSIGVAVYAPSESLPVEVGFGSVIMSEPPASDEFSSAVKAPEVVSDTVTPTVEVTETPAVDTSTPEAQSFYTEEFDGNLDAWEPYLAFGDESQVSVNAEDGKLIVQLSPTDASIPALYFYNTAFTYTDVRLDVITTNAGNNANDVILVCQSTENGQYEFDISNSGLYSIYAVDASYNYSELASGTSGAIGSGLAVNTYTAVCKGNELSLYVNGELVNTIQDTAFNFTQGNIGFGISAIQALPIDLSIDSLTVSQP